MHDFVAFFHDVAALARLTPHLAAFDRIDAATVGFTLDTHRDLGLEFTPRYRLHYTWETPRTLTWCTVPVDACGRLSFCRCSFGLPIATAAAVTADETLVFALRTMR